MISLSVLTILGGEDESSNGQQAASANWQQWQRDNDNKGGNHV
jgi:hypothetical protein